MMRRELVYAIIFYGGINFILFMPVLLQNKTWTPFDLIDQNFLYPPKEKKMFSSTATRWDGMYDFFLTDYYLNREIKNFNFPLWNPYILSGHPVFADGQNGFLNPVRIILHSLFSPWKARDLFVFIHLILTGFFMFLYLRKLSLSFYPSLFGGFVYSFSLPITGHIPEEFYISTFAYLPFLLFSYEKAVNEKSKIWIAIGGFLLALILLGRYLPSAYFSLLIFGSVFLFKMLTNSKNYKEITVSFFLILLLGFLISFIQLLPTIELISLSSEQRGKDLDVLGRRFPWVFRIALMVINFFSPIFPGSSLDINPETDPPFDPFVISGFTGILSFFLLILSALNLREKKETQLYLFLYAIFSLSYLHTPINYILSFLPSFKRLAILVALPPVIAFLSSVLSSTGAEVLLNNPSNVKKWLSIFIASLLSLGSVIFALIIYGKILPLPWMSFGNIRIFSPILIIFVIVYTFFIKMSPYLKGLSLILISMVELLPLSFSFNKPCSVPDLKWEYLSQEKSDLYRTSSDIGLNLYMIFQIYSTDGYKALIPDYYIIGTKPEIKGFPVRTFTLEDLSYPVARLLGVKRIVSSNAEQIKFPKELLYKVKEVGVITIFEVRDVLERVFVVGSSKRVSNWKEASELIKNGYNPLEGVLIEENVQCSGGQGSARIVEYRDEEVIVQTHVEGGCAFLVLSDTYYPGWKVYVDGKEEKVLRAYGFIRAVPIENGEHNVRFVFKPWWILPGGILSGIGILGCFILIIFELMKKSL
jgi:hypothetical protein